MVEIYDKDYTFQGQVVWSEKDHYLTYIVKKFRVELDWHTGGKENHNLLLPEQKQNIIINYLSAVNGPILDPGLLLILKIWFVVAGAGFFNILTTNL